MPVIAPKPDVERAIADLLRRLGYSDRDIAILLESFRSVQYDPAEIVNMLRPLLPPEREEALVSETGKSLEALFEDAIGGPRAAPEPLENVPTVPEGGGDGADAAAALAERMIGGILNIAGRITGGVAGSLAGTLEGKGGAAKGGGGPAGAPGSAGELLSGSATVPSEIGGLARELFLGRDPDASIEFLLQETGFRGPRIIRDFLTDQGDFFSVLAGLTYLETLEPGVEFRFIKQALADFLGGTGGVTGLANVRRLVSELDLNSPTVESIFGNDVSDTATFLGTVLAPFIPGAVLRGLFNSRNLRREEIQYKAAAARGYTGNALQWLIDRGLVPWRARSGQLSAEGTVAKPRETPFVEIPLAKKQAGE